MEAAKLYQLVLHANPNSVIALGNYAYMLQNVCVDLDEARKCYERALALLPNDVINLNNFASVCLVRGDVQDAERALSAAWAIASCRKDRFACRTLFLRCALAVLRREDPQLFLGQLKSIFESGISSAPSENVSLMKHLREHLSADECVLLKAVFDAINNGETLSALFTITQWREAPLHGLDEPWPNTAQ